MIATQHFAPRSLVVLGLSFLLASALMTIFTRQLDLYPTPLAPNLAMGATFGLFHLIYALCVRSSSRS